MQPSQEAPLDAHSLIMPIISQECEGTRQGQDRFPTLKAVTAPCADEAEAPEKVHKREQDAGL